jgi:hypothetical protein
MNEGNVFLRKIQMIKFALCERKRQIFSVVFDCFVDKLIYQCRIAMTFNPGITVHVFSLTRRLFLPMIFYKLNICSD